MTQDLLLDTHVLVWLMNGEETLSLEARALIKNTCKQHCLVVASISVWEIGMLQSKGKISLIHPLHRWIKKVSSLRYIKMTPLSAEIAIESCELPGEFHGDPADRMIVATARVFDIPLMTRDKKIEDYGKQGYIKVVSC